MCRPRMRCESEQEQEQGRRCVRVESVTCAALENEEHQPARDSIVLPEMVVVSCYFQLPVAAQTRIDDALRDALSAQHVRVVVEDLSSSSLKRWFCPSAAHASLTRFTPRPIVSHSHQELIWPCTHDLQSASMSCQSSSWPCTFLSARCRPPIGKLSCSLQLNILTHTHLCLPIQNEPITTVTALRPGPLRLPPGVQSLAVHVTCSVASVGAQALLHFR